MMNTVNAIGNIGIGDDRLNKILDSIGRSKDKIQQWLTEGRVNIFDYLKEKEAIVGKAQKKIVDCLGHNDDRIDQSETERRLLELRAQTLESSKKKVCTIEDDYKRIEEELKANTNELEHVFKEMDDLRLKKGK